MVKTGRRRFRPTATRTKIDWNPGREPIGAIVARLEGVLRPLVEREEEVALWSILLREALTNVVRHGWGGRPGASARVTVKRDGPRLEVRVIDAGGRPAPTARSPRRRVGGLGTLVLRHGSHGLRRRRILGRHVVRLVRPAGAWSGGIPLKAGRAERRT